MRFLRLLNRFASSRGSVLTVHKLVCASTVEDTFSSASFGGITENNKLDKAAAAALDEDNGGIVWKIKRKALDELFGVNKTEFGDNGIKREEEESDECSDKVRFFALHNIGSIYVVVSVTHSIT
jgi:hypothetical protein